MDDTSMEADIVRRGIGLGLITSRGERGGVARGTIEGMIPRANTRRKCGEESFPLPLRRGLVFRESTLCVSRVYEMNLRFNLISPFLFTAVELNLMGIFSPRPLSYPICVRLLMRPAAVSFIVTVMLTLNIADRFFDERIIFVTRCTRCYFTVPKNYKSNVQVQFKNV